ncbi:uncharacterized protein LOC119769839 [Culex quinquefasciatus]|uniref:uncharacterized protein LOC119769839 n=1 Tax=Culex quinquefasciatus TaxID=7176 RepID=UPI0018E2FAD5|nr:uncharacterized protein LOC119769839 [Culex quinquefasciatus]
MLDDHHFTGNEVPGHKLRPSCYVTTLGGQVHINIVDLLTTEVRSEIQRDEYAATSPHRVVSSRRALLKEKLRTIEAEQLRQEQEIERRLEAKQREFDEAMHRIKERRRQIEEETAVRLLQLQICKSTSIAESKQRQSSCNSPTPQKFVPQPHYLPPIVALGTDELSSSPQLPPGTGRRGRDDEFIRMDSQQQKSRNELPLVKRILQDPSCINSSHTSLTFPGRSDVNFRPPSVPHVLETLRTSFYSSRYLYSAVHQRHLSETLRKWPAGAEFCNWTSRAKKQIHHSMTTNARSLKQTPLNAASSSTQHRDTKLLTLYPIAFDDTGQQWFVIVFRYCDDRNQSVRSKHQTHTYFGLHLYWFNTWGLITRTDHANATSLRQVIDLLSEGKQHPCVAIRNQVIVIFGGMGRNRRSPVGSSKGTWRSGRRGNCFTDIAAENAIERASQSSRLDHSVLQLNNAFEPSARSQPMHSNECVALSPDEQRSGGVGHPTVDQGVTVTFRRAATLAVLDVLGDSKPTIATLPTLGSRVGVCCDEVHRQILPQRLTVHLMSTESRDATL